MTEINRSALMPYSAADMYAIVNDVAAYPQYLPWCGGTRIHEQTETMMEASIQMKKAGLNHWFRTRNRMEPGRQIEVSLVKGPFKQLQGNWTFTPLDDEACRISLALQFEVSSGIVGMVLAPAFSQIANTMVDSFCQRARKLYG